MESAFFGVSRAKRALKRSGSRIFIPYNESGLFEIEKLKPQTYKLRRQISELYGKLVRFKIPNELMTAICLNFFIYSENTLKEVR